MWVVYPPSFRLSFLPHPIILPSFPHSLYSNNEIFPPVLPPSPYHSPLLPPLPSNNEIIFSSSFTVQKLIHEGHAIHLKFKPTIETKEKVHGCWDLHLLKAKQASGTLTRVCTLKIQFYCRCHHNRFATVFQLQFSLTRSFL